jgi:23S rRNA (adenine2030-N6)-methyltransferase
MLSYQHAYHAGNLADVHKHSALAWALNYLTQKDKPVSYIETHAGRALYDLSGSEAQKTGEAAKGITRVLSALPAADPYRQAIETIRKTHGDTAYPGSPLIARTLLRESDTLHLAELHPAESAALKTAIRARNTNVYQQDGFELAQSLTPPTPRRGLMLVDPSWEVKSDYQTLPPFLRAVMRKWNVGIVMIWYPILTDKPHIPMLAAFQNDFPEGYRHEVAFPPAREGHRMVGSGLFITNPPWGMDEALNAFAKTLFSKA